MTVIKECPFCGSEVELTKIPLWNGVHGYRDCYRYDIRCEKCGCHRNLGDNDTIYNTDDVARKNALDKWNERSSK